MANEPFSYASARGQRADTLIVKLSGPLTLTTMFSFQDEFRAMKPPVLILDLSNSPYMDSAGMGLIVNQYVSCENGGRKFLVCGVNYRIAALFELTKINRILKVFATAEEAEASLHPGV